MLSAIQIAQYFLSKDPERKMFTKKLIIKNGRKFYEGNARLNKYLHIAQNIHIAKTGEKLFMDELYAYDNGAVVTEVREKYAVLAERTDAPGFSEDIEIYLDKIFIAFMNADLDELIEISHEDPEWINKHNGNSKESQRMDSLSRADEYRNFYKDIIKVLDRMTI